MCLFGGVDGDEIMAVCVVVWLAVCRDSVTGHGIFRGRALTGAYGGERAGGEREPSLSGETDTPGARILGMTRKRVRPLRCAENGAARVPAPRAGERSDWGRSALFENSSTHAAQRHLRAGWGTIGGRMRAWVAVSEPTPCTTTPVMSAALSIGDARRAGCGPAAID